MFNGSNILAYVAPRIEIFHHKKITRS